MVTGKEYPDHIVNYPLFMEYNYFHVYKNLIPISIVMHMQYHFSIMVFDLFSK